MLNEQSLSATLIVEKKIYYTLSEVLELTDELSNALTRKDEVSLRLFLGMRQEQINLLDEYSATLRKQCSLLPKVDAEILLAIIRGEEVSCAGSQNLKEQIKKNRALLERVVMADKRISEKLCGKKSIYNRNK